MKQKSLTLDNVYSINFISNQEIEITYFGELYKNSSKSCQIVYGFGEKWSNTTNQDMELADNGFVFVIELGDFNILNFCFCNESGIWDNNYNKNYSFKYCIEKTEKVEKTKEYKQIVDEKIEQKIQEKNHFKNYDEVKEENLAKDISVENILMDDEIKDNCTLLISEIQNKVFLPYTREEVEGILQNEYYEDAQSVINDKFVKPFSEYKNLYGARIRETYKLLTEREKYTKLDATEIVLELFKNKYLHPAIISACRNLDELDVYLDCLAKNELEDFKIFEIKYELYPIVVKKLGIVRKTYSFIKIVLNKLKGIFKRNKTTKDDSINL